MGKGQGLPDAVESIIGTNPAQPDGRNLLVSNGLDPDGLESSGLSAEPIIFEVLEGQAVNYTPSVSGGSSPFTWSLSGGSLPEGLSLSSVTTGTLSGTPTLPGISTFTLVVQDANSAALAVPGYIRVLALSDTTTDTDGDGVASTAEITAGTNPLAADTDSDGVSDLDDAFPNDPTEWFDTDGDGIGNNQDSDDDDDGLPDEWELANLLDPLSALDAAEDTDGDGLTNLEEFGYGTDPQNPDSDSDGTTDGEEVTLGRDPLVNEPAILISIINILLS